MCIEREHAGSIGSPFALMSGLLLQLNVLRLDGCATTIGLVCWYCTTERVGLL